MAEVWGREKETKKRFVASVEVVVFPWQVQLHGCVGEVGGERGRKGVG